jgi:outer membrane immunogenic protein
VTEQENRMKRILIAGAFALAAGTQAFAADLPPPVQMPPRAPAVYVPAPSPAYNWGGIYLGVNAGYAFGSSTWTGTSGSFALDGPMAGGTLGFNYQVGTWVLGGEGDFDWQNLRGASTTGPCNVGPGSPGGCDTSSNWIGTFRGRVGYAFDRILLYGTAGGAVTNLKASTGTLLPAAGTPTWQSNTELGWTAGAGVEAALTDNLTAKLEYLFADFSHATCSAAASCAAAVTPSTVSFYENMVRLGVNYKFNF